MDLNQLLSDSGYIYDSLLSNYGFTTVGEVTLTSAIISKPLDSLLAETDIVFEFDNSTNSSVVFSVLPDVPGYYTLELQAYDGFLMGTKEISFSVLDGTQGVVDVTFE